MRATWTRQKFRVKLRSSHKGMSIVLHYLYEGAIGRQACSYQSNRSKLVSKRIIEFKPMPVPLQYNSIAFSISFRGDTHSCNFTRIDSQSHRAPLISDTNLIRHQVYDWIISILVKFSRVSILFTKKIPCSFYNHNLHTEAKAKVRYSILPSITHGIYHAFYTSISKTTRHYDTCYIR